MRTPWRLWQTLGLTNALMYFGIATSLSAEVELVKTSTLLTDLLLAVGLALILTSPESSPGPGV